uniref:Putative secreted protein n=1 Tax=Ixodes ricinus TaxID=34613 RepID=A0A6B0U9K8_IXORI
MIHHFTIRIQVLLVPVLEGVNDHLGERIDLLGNDREEHPVTLGIQGPCPTGIPLLALLSRRSGRLNLNRLRFPSCCESFGRLWCV